MRMLKLSHKRPRAGEAPTRGLVGVPSNELGFLRGQRLAGAGFAACLFIGLVVVLVVVLSADVDEQKSSVSAKGAYNHRCIHCNAYLSYRPCSYVECSCCRFFDATDLAAFWGEPLLTTACPKAPFATVHGPQ